MTKPNLYMTFSKFKNTILKKKEQEQKEENNPQFI